MKRETYESLLKTQRELSELIGVSGHEEPVRQFVYSRVGKLLDKYGIDPLGSLVGLIEGTGGRERILLDAHMDEVGLMVSHIEPGGFLRFAAIGDWDNRILPGQAVRMAASAGTLIPGVIASLPPHLAKREAAEAWRIEELYIDLGFDNPDEVTQAGITIGSVGTLYDSFEVLGSGKIRGKAFDDRSGVNILIHVIEELSANRPHDTLAVSFSVQEEVGLRGAGACAYALEPTIALALENTVAADVPGISPDQCPTVLGKGPAITLADKSLIADRRVNSRLVENAKHENIPFQFKKPLFGNTNAGAIQRSRHGVAASVVSVPCRYIHSSTSLLSLEDLAQTLRLVSAFVRNPAGAG